MISQNIITILNLCFFVISVLPQIISWQRTAPPFQLHNHGLDNEDVSQVLGTAPLESPKICDPSRCATSNPNGNIAHIANIQYVSLLFIQYSSIFVN